MRKHSCPVVLGREWLQCLVLKWWIKNAHSWEHGKMFMGNVHIECPAAWCSRMIFCVGCASGHICTSGDSFLLVQPHSATAILGKAYPGLKPVTLASWFHAVTSWAPPTAARTGCANLFLLQEGSWAWAAGHLEPGPCLSWIGSRVTVVEPAEWEHHQSNQDGSHRGSFSQMGTASLGPVALLSDDFAPTARCLIPYPPHQPMFPRPRFNFLLF